MKAYVSGDYQSAITFFKSISTQDTNFSETRFYLSLCLLKINEPMKAINQLDQLYQTGNNRFLPQIRWYLALSYLKNDQPQVCAEYLATIQPDEFKYQEARQLIGILKR